MLPRLVGVQSSGDGRTLRGLAGDDSTGSGDDPRQECDSGVAQCSTLERTRAPAGLGRCGLPQRWSLQGGYRLEGRAHCVVAPRSLMGPAQLELPKKRIVTQRCAWGRRGPDSSRGDGASENGRSRLLARLCLLRSRPRRRDAAHSMGAVIGFGSGGAGPRPRRCRARALRGRVPDRRPPGSAPPRDPHEDSDW